MASSPWSAALKSETLRRAESIVTTTHQARAVRPIEGFTWVPSSCSRALAPADPVAAAYGVTARFTVSFCPRATVSPPDFESRSYSARLGPSSQAVTCDLEAQDAEAEERNRRRDASTHHVVIPGTVPGVRMLRMSPSSADDRSPGGLNARPQSSRNLGQSA
jgi:hypothetical protein